MRFSQFAYISRHTTRACIVTRYPSSNMQQRESLSTRCTALTKCPHPNEKIWQCVCILAFLFTVAGGFLSSSQPLVVTKWGKIRGKWSKSNGVLGNRIIANFLGIPYALPPVGDLRFKVRILSATHAYKLVNLSLCFYLYANNM